MRNTTNIVWEPDVYVGFTIQIIKKACATYLKKVKQEMTRVVVVATKFWTLHKNQDYFTVEFLKST